MAMSLEKYDEHDQSSDPSTAIYALDSEAEKRLIRKLDLRIVPALFVLYTLSYLDRANIGNAKAGGMGADLKLTPNQYSIILLIFFPSYLIFEIPSNMILTRVRPSIYLSGLCFLWGGVAASMAATNSWQQLAGVRFTLGMVEAGFYPGVTFYLSSWYKPHELARRFSLFYTASAVSGVISGLLAGVITDHLHLARGIAGWRWLLLIEGIASSFAACFTWMILPDWPTTTTWLTPEERFIASRRLSFHAIGRSGLQDQEPTHWESVKMAFSDWRTWMLAVMYMLATGSQTIQYFIPTIVSQLGYTGFIAQYMTIPIYVVAIVGIVVFCFISDWRKERGNYITIVSAIGCVSFIVVVASNNNRVKYAFLCFAVGAVYAACPLTILWVPGIINHPTEKRAIAIAIVNGLGNSANIYGSFLWPSTTGPRYAQGFATTTAFIFLLGIIAQLLKWLMQRYPPTPLDHLTEKSLDGEISGKPSAS